MIDDFVRFAKYQTESGDIDPAYPVLSFSIQELCDSEQEALELILLYVAFYNLGSSLAVWLDGYRFDRELSDGELRYSTGVERRAHRDIRQFRKHLESLASVRNRYGSFVAWLKPQTDNPKMSWLIVQERLAQIHGNARWAGYKTGEILNDVLKWGCPPPDAGHAHSSGPRKGLKMLYPETSTLDGNDRATVSVLDRHTDHLCSATGLPVAQVETALCDFNSLIGGSYYMGHDIDLMFEQSKKINRADVGDIIARARESRFEDRWLAEKNDWPGVRKNLKTLYRDHKIIEWWEQ